MGIITTTRGGYVEASGVYHREVDLTRFLRWPDFQTDSIDGDGTEVGTRPPLQINVIPNRTGKHPFSDGIVIHENPTNFSY